MEKDSAVAVAKAAEELVNFSTGLEVA